MSEYLFGRRREAAFSFEEATYLDWIGEVAQGGIGALALTLAIAVVVRESKGKNGRASDKWIATAFENNTAAYTRLADSIESQGDVMQSLGTSIQLQSAMITELREDVKELRLARRGAK